MSGVCFRSTLCEPSQAFHPTRARDKRDRSARALSPLFFSILAHVYLPALTSRISNADAVSDAERDYQAEAIRRPSSRFNSRPVIPQFELQHSLQTQKP